MDFNPMDKCAYGLLWQSEKDTFGQLSDVVRERSLRLLTTGEYAHLRQYLRCRTGVRHVESDPVKALLEVGIKAVLDVCVGERCELAVNKIKKVSISLYVSISDLFDPGFCSGFEVPSEVIEMNVTWTAPSREPRRPVPRSTASAPE